MYSSMFLLAIVVTTSMSEATCKNYIFSPEYYSIPVPVGSCYISYNTDGDAFSLGYKCEDRSGIPYAVQYYYENSNCEGNSSYIYETKCESSDDDYCECTINNGVQCDLFSYQFAADESTDKSCTEEHDNNYYLYQFVTNDCLKWNNTHSVQFYCNGYQLDAKIYFGMDCSGFTQPETTTTTTTSSEAIDPSDINCDKYVCNDISSPFIQYECYPKGSLDNDDLLNSINIDNDTLLYILMGISGLLLICCISFMCCFIKSRKKPDNYETAINMAQR